jgi:hypothetical protein
MLLLRSDVFASQYPASRDRNRPGCRRRLWEQQAEGVEPLDERNLRPGELRAPRKFHPG